MFRTSVANVQHNVKSTMTVNHDDEDSLMSGEDIRQLLKHVSSPTDDDDDDNRNRLLFTSKNSSSDVATDAECYVRQRLKALSCERSSETQTGERAGAASDDVGDKEFVLAAGEYLLSSCRPVSGCHRNLTLIRGWFLLICVLSTNALLPINSSSFHKLVL